MSHRRSTEVGEGRHDAGSGPPRAKRFQRFTPGTAAQG